MLDSVHPLGSPEERKEATSFPKVQGFGQKNKQTKTPPNKLEGSYRQKYSELPPPGNKQLIKREKRGVIRLHALLFSTNCS